MSAADSAREHAGPPWLVSFPRTGSHWLRMALELYFDRPLLPRSFFGHERADPLLTHDHDNELDLRPTGPVIYLYRGPVDTVFSEMTYYAEDLAVQGPADLVRRTAERYRRHLRRWLLGEAPGRAGSAERTDTPVVTVAYEWMLDRPAAAVAPVIVALGGAFEPERFAQVWARVTPAAVASKTGHDPSVIDRGAAKELRRELFRYRFGPMILDIFHADADLRRAIDPALLGLPGAAA